VDAATLDQVGLWVAGGGLALSTVSVVAANAAESDARLEEKEVAAHVLADARDNGLTRQAPSFVSYTKPDTGEPLGEPPAWCAGFVVGGYEAAAFGYGSRADERCVIQIRTPRTPELRVVRIGAPAEEKLRLRLVKAPSVRDYRGEVCSVYAADERFAHAFRQLAVVPYDGLLTPDKDSVPELDRPQAIGLADGVISIEVAATTNEKIFEYAKNLLALLRDVPDSSWRAYGQPNQVPPGHGGRYFRSTPGPREQRYRSLTALGLVPAVLVAIAFGVAEICRSLSYLTELDAQIFSGEELPAVFGGRFAAVPTSSLAANAWAVLGGLIVFLVGSLAMRVARWTGIRVPTLSAQFRTLLRRAVLALTAGVLLLVLINLSMAGWVAMGLAVVLDLVVAGLILGAVIALRRLLQRDTAGLDRGAYLLLAVLLIPGAYLAGNSAAVLVGAATTVDVTVTNVDLRHAYEGPRPTEALWTEPLPYLDVAYELDGERHVVADKRWYGEREAAPDEGDTLTTAIAPLWPHQLLPDRASAAEAGSLGVAEFLLIFFLVGGVLAFRKGGRGVEPPYAAAEPGTSGLDEEDARG
jgi:hypothetical protein